MHRSGWSEHKNAEQKIKIRPQNATGIAEEDGFGIRVGVARSWLGFAQAREGDHDLADQRDR